MSSQAAAVDVPTKTPLLKSRLGSFLAVVPLSIWVINHIWDNLAAFNGAAAWESSVTGYTNPFTQIVTFIIVLLPLLLHTGWGLIRLFNFKPNNGRYNNYGNLKYILQRLSAVGVLFFLGAHIWLAFLRPHLLLGHPERFDDIAREMHHHLPTLIVYLLGTMGTAYHLANGLQGFAMYWGLVASERSMRRFEPVAIGLFLLLTAMSWAVIYALYQAGAAFTPTGA
jgi:succinate dehydrogenase / fumarate reductase cytochrome b subunit